MSEVFQTLHFGLLGEFTLQRYKLCCVAFLLQKVKHRVSKEKGTENESYEEEEATRFWRMTVKPVVLVVTSGRCSLYPVHHSRNKEEQANVAWEWVILRGCNISILGDFKNLSRL